MFMLVVVLEIRDDLRQSILGIRTSEEAFGKEGVTGKIFLIVIVLVNKRVLYWHYPDWCLDSLML